MIINLFKKIKKNKIKPGQSLSAYRERPNTPNPLINHAQTCGHLSLSLHTLACLFFFKSLRANRPVVDYLFLKKNKADKAQNPATFKYIFFLKTYFQLFFYLKISNKHSYNIYKCLSTQKTLKIPNQTR